MEDVVNNIVNQLKKQQQKYVGYKNEIDTYEMSFHDSELYSLYDGYDYAYQDAISIIIDEFKKFVKQKEK